jgi:putative acetyltransferase
MEIRLDDLCGKEITELLLQHVQDMHFVSRESTHVLDIDQLRKPNIKFWTIWMDDRLAGCGALKLLSQNHAEIKSMRVADSSRRQGVGAAMLRHLLEQGREMGMQRISLETGSMDFFTPARTMYEQAGFAYCRPFGDYVEDPNSVFMTLEL